MAKFYGVIGFAETKEVVPGVWQEEITERYYSGDLVRNTRKLQSSGNVNDNIVIANDISIIGDAYVNDNVYNMRYVVIRGVKWKITSVEIQYPRLLLTIGEVYNAE